MGASPLLFSPPLTLPPLASTKKMPGLHHAPGSPGLTAQPPTSKNKSAPIAIESENSEIGEHTCILS